MEYPLISEYREAIIAAKDNFNELASLRPVLDSHGDPVMSSGNFAVVFKMKNESDGKLYAVKCFIKDQEGRDESYRKIADELEVISSTYILPLRYLENELFVDTAHCSQEEFPIVVMEWVEGETLDAYLNRNLNDIYELDMLSYRFNRMAAWLLSQPFAHGDLKPDNILVRKEGSLVLVDYDGMFVPSMKGEKAREIGSPDYRHPSRTESDFNEHIDDFSIAVIALSLKTIAIRPDFKLCFVMSDTLLFKESDFLDITESIMFQKLLALGKDADLLTLLGVFMIALSKKELDSLAFRLFSTEKPTTVQSNSIQFIKNQLLRINKQKLSYFAIINILISSKTNIVGGGLIRHRWITNSDQLLVRCDASEGDLIGEYSFDNGKCWNKIILKGDAYNLNEVCKFTYILFNQCKVLKEFIEKGAKVIDYLNKQAFFNL